jgi:hypothetical protein
MTDADAIAKFTDPAAGSSRRRWDHLMLRDDSAVVEMEDLMEIMRWLVGKATDRPTAPSASSSR